MTTKPVPGIAVIGCGQWGRNLVRNFRKLTALRAVSDINPEVARQHAATCDVPALTLDQILRSPEIDGVVIAAPAELHASLTQKALEAGKHVFVEKPIALQVSEGERLVALADAADRVLMVGHLLHYHPAFLTLKAMVAEGRLGRLQYIYSNRLNLGRIRREENILWSFAPHDISMILALAGELPVRVHGVGSCYLHKVIADVTVTNLVFANGINAHIHVSWLHPFKEQKLVVIGEAGMAVFDDLQPWPDKLTLYPHQIAWRDGIPCPDKADRRSIPVEPAEPLRLECEHFLECMVTRQRPRTHGREALAVLRVLAAAEESIVRHAGVPLSTATGRTDPLATPEPPNRTVEGRSESDTVFVHESSVVDPGVTLGAGTRIWHFSHILGGSRIGRGCTIGQNVMIGPDVTVGDGCKIQNNVSLYKGVTLEADVFCGPSCVFTNVANPRAEIDRKAEFLPTHVEQGATIGANATIVCGSRLGQYCFIGAGAVVTRDVPAYALMAGVPARRIGWVGAAGERLGPDLVCPRTGMRYREDGPERLIKDGRIEDGTPPGNP